MHFQAPKKTGPFSVTKFTPAAFTPHAETALSRAPHAARLALAAVLAGALTAASFATYAQQAAGTQSGQATAPRTSETSRPAPVSGRIGSDPAAVALHPAAPAPVPTVSTAMPVAPPKHLNEPLLSPVVPEPSAYMKPEPVARKQLHVDRTKGTKKPSKVPGKKRDKKAAGKPHGALHQLPAKGDKHGAPGKAGSKNVNKAGSKLAGTAHKAAGHTQTALAGTRQHAPLHAKVTHAKAQHTVAPAAKAVHTQAPAAAAHMVIAPSRPTPRHRQVD
jgi:hypothetical protein